MAKNREFLPGDEVRIVDPLPESGIDDIAIVNSLEIDGYVEIIFSGGKSQRVRSALIERIYR